MKKQTPEKDISPDDYHQVFTPRAAIGMYYENQRSGEWARIFDAPPTFVTEFSNKLESLNIKLVAA